jgi:hypothetical protein
MTTEPPNGEEISIAIVKARAILGREFFDRHWKRFICACASGNYPEILLDMFEEALGKTRDKDEEDSK